MRTMTYGWPAAGDGLEHIVHLRSRDGMGPFLIYDVYLAPAHEPMDARPLDEPWGTLIGSIQRWQGPAQRQWRPWDAQGKPLLRTDGQPIHFSERLSALDCLIQHHKRLQKGAA